MRAARRLALAAALVGGLVAAPAALPAGAALAVPASVADAAAGAASLSVLETSTGFTTSGWKTWPKGTPSAYPIIATAVVDVYNTDNRVERATGDVVFYLDGVQYGPPVTVDAEGIAHMTMPTDKVGTYQVHARYLGTPTQAPSTSRTLEYIVQPPVVVPHYPMPAKSSVKASFKKLSKHRVKAKIVVSASRPASGRVEIRYGSKVVAKGTLKGGAKSITLTTKKLKKGKRKLKIRFVGSSSVRAASKTYIVRVR